MAWHPRNHHDRTHQRLRARTRHIMAPPPMAASRSNPHDMAVPALAVQPITRSHRAGGLRFRQ
jgi:hypothetical protein